LATLVLTLLLYVFVPKGFFPVQDTGVILGISEAPDSFRSTRMASGSRSWRKSHSAGSGRGEPVFVHRRRRHQHHAEQRTHSDQPEAARSAQSDASEIIRRLQPELAKIDGITLYMQPVQDLTVEDRVSRTQFQYTMEDATRRNWRSGRRSWWKSCATLPELRDVATDQLNNGSRRISPSTATPRRGWASCRRPSTTRCTTPSDSGRSRPSSRS
jgi:multidrug efflux pump